MTILRPLADGEDVTTCGCAGSGHHAFRFPLSPGDHSELTLRTRTGRYSLWCSVADHAQLGMRAVLRVRR